MKNFDSCPGALHRATVDAAGVSPGSYIADLLPRIDTWPHRRLDELLPLAWATADE